MKIANSIHMATLSAGIVCLGAGWSGPADLFLAGIILTAIAVNANWDEVRHG